MPRSTPHTFKDYGPSDRTLDRRDHNRRADAIESIFASLPADGIVTKAGIITRKQLSPVSVVFDAKIISLVARSGHHRFDYDLVEVEILKDGTARVLDGGREVTAFNQREIKHTAANAWNVDLTLADYPTNYNPQPIGGGGTGQTLLSNDIVTVVERTDPDDGDVFYTISEFGTHDGNC